MSTLAEQKLLIERHQKKVPVDVLPIAKDLGVNVYQVSGWPDTVSGRIFRSAESGGDSGYAIEVNANHSDERRRFTIAHELAHLLLHSRLIGDELYDDALYRSGLSHRVETQANQFAARILMPDFLLQEELAKGHVGVEDLARRFRVSPQAMALRLGRRY